MSGDIGVKILEVVGWSQLSNQLLQLESVAGRALKLLQASSRFCKVLEAAARVWISGNWNQVVENNKSLNLLNIFKYKSAASRVKPAELESAAK